MDSPHKAVNTDPAPPPPADTTTPPGGSDGGDGRVPWVLAEPKDRGEEFQGRSNPVGLIAIFALFALLWFGAGVRMTMVVFGLIVMIFLHELGHYLTAKWTGMKVTQFFLFMGPRIWSFRRGETEYGVRLLPVGAFVRIVGMNNLDPCDPEDEPRAYRNKSYPRRLLVISAGSIMHFVQALVLFVIVTSVVGMNDPAKWSVGRITSFTDPEIVAAEAGLQPGDEIIAVDGLEPAEWARTVEYNAADDDEVTLTVARGDETVTETVGLADLATPAVEAGLQTGDDILAIDGMDATQWEETVEYIQQRPGEAVDLLVQRGDETFDRTVTLAQVPGVDGEQASGFLGVGPDFERTRQGPWEGVKLLGETTTTALTAIPQFLSPSTLSQLATLLFSGSEQVSIDSDEAQRPVSVWGGARIAAQPDLDITVPLTLLGVFNVFIGIFNMLPLLPLDGGHAAIATYERLRSRNGRRYHADVAKLLPMAYAVVGLLGFIMVSTVILDIVRPIG